MNKSRKLLAWGSWMASMSVLTLTSAWLLAQLSSSPIINSLLIAAQNIPAFLPLKRNIIGVKYFFISVTLLEIIIVLYYFNALPHFTLAILTLIISLTAATGGIISTLPITALIIDKSSISNRLLQLSSDIGNFGGTIIGGIVYPCLMLFPPLLFLTIPAAWISESNLKRTSQSIDLSSQQPHQSPPLDRWCLLQGFCVGALFGLLPLWTSSVKLGTEIDFSLILGAFMLGRISERRLLPEIPPCALYLLSSCLLLVAFYPNIPLAAGVIAFIPLGASTIRIEFHLIDHLKKHGEIAYRRDILLRSLAIGAVLGSIVIGIIGQLIGIRNAMLSLVCMHAITALITYQWKPVTKPIT